MLKLYAAMKGYLCINYYKELSHFILIFSKKEKYILERAMCSLSVGICTTTTAYSGKRRAILYSVNNYSAILPSVDDATII